MITGKVLAADTKQPLSNANVFLSHSSFGTATSADGSFELNGLKPGQYTLVATTIGYEDYTQTILVNNQSIKLNIELKPKAIQLNEVVVSAPSKENWKVYYRLFREDFIGTDKNAADCKILNPEVLHFSYQNTTHTLNAYTNDFLIIENRALGYRIKYLINSFKREGLEGIVTYAGQPLFEELPGKESEKKKWRKKRDEAYYGSPMHFYRSLYKDSLATEGFELYRLSRKLNPSHPRQEPVKTSPNQFRTVTETDVGPIYINQSLSKGQWKRADILRTSGQPGLFTITFPDCLYVVYTKKRERNFYKGVYRPVEMPNYEISIVSLFNNPPHALFDMNGIIVGESPLYEGTWSNNRLSELLPVDYTPAKR